MLIVCTRCQSNIRVPDEAVGKKGKCPKCGLIMVIAEVTPTVPAPLPLPPMPQTAYASQLPPPLPAEAPPAPRAPASRTLAPPRRYEDDEPIDRRYEDDDDDDDLSIRRHQRSAGKGMAITAMVLGSLGLLFALAGTLAIVGGFGLVQNRPDLCCIGFTSGWAGIGLSGILGILGIVFGSIGLNQSGRPFAWVGLITGSLTVLLVLLYIVLVILMMCGIFIAAGAAANAGAQQQAQPPFAPPVQRR